MIKKKSAFLLPPPGSSDSGEKPLLQHRFFLILVRSSNFEYDELASLLPVQCDSTRVAMIDYCMHG